jgi:hypothetical protein
VDRVGAAHCGDNRYREGVAEKKRCPSNKGPDIATTTHGKSRSRGNHVNTTAPTADERRLAATYQDVLAEVARCAQAIHDGDWPRLATTATDLSRSAVLLAVAAHELREPTTPPRADTVLDTVARHHASPITRVLHPTLPASVAKTTMTDPFTHPGT